MTPSFGSGQQGRLGGTCLSSLVTGTKSTSGLPIGAAKDILKRSSMLSRTLTLRRAWWIQLPAKPIKHQQGLKKKGPQAIGVSRGGMNTKIHALCDALGNPVRFKLTPGQAADSPELLDLIEDLPIQAILADKAYDADAIITAAQAADIAVVIPSKRNRKVERAMDSARYRARHLIENLLQRSSFNTCCCPLSAYTAAGGDNCVVAIGCAAHQACNADKSSWPGQCSCSPRAAPAPPRQGVVSAAKLGSLPAASPHTVLPDPQAF